MERTKEDLGRVFRQGQPPRWKADRRLVLEVTARKTRVCGRCFQVRWTPADHARVDEFTFCGHAPFSEEKEPKRRKPVRK